jgi:hypothetical protein
MCLVSDYQGYLKTQSSFRGMAVIFQSVSYNNHEGFKALFQMVFYKRYSSQSDFGIRSIVLRKDLVVQPESYDNACLAPLPGLYRGIAGMGFKYLRL